MIVLYKIIYLMFALAIETEYVLGCLYFSQQFGYTYSSLVAHLFRLIKKDYAIWILYAFVVVLLAVIHPNNIYLLCGLVILMGGLIVLLGDKYNGAKKLKYTKRVVRILVAFGVVLCGYLTLQIAYFSNLLLLIFLPLLLVVNYIIFMLTYLCLMPLEILIKRSYERKTKLKLRSMKNLVKIGITGSYGKTSTKEILSTILATSFYTLATPKSYNTPMGISRTVLENLEPLHEVFVCEMGAKKVGEIKELCDLVDVEYGIVTSVGRQHTSTFGSINNVYRTKKELPDYLTHKSCVFNLANCYVRKMYDNFVGNKIGVFLLFVRDKSQVRKVAKNYDFIKAKRCLIDNNLVLFDNIKQNNVYAKNIKLDEKGSSFEVYFGENKVCDATTILVGVHNVINILLSIAMAKMLGVSNENIKIGIENIKQVKARLERFEGSGGAVILNNGYNSNIDSVDYSLKAVKLYNKPNILVVTPGVIDCKNPFEINKKFGSKISSVATEVVIVKRVNKDAIYLGLVTSGFDKSKIYFANKFDEVKSVLNRLGNDYVVLIENDLPDGFL